VENKLMNVGVLSFGLCAALVLSPSNAAASEDSLMVDVNVLSKEDGKSSVLYVEISDVPIVGDVNMNIPSELETEPSEALATVEVSDGVMDDLDVSLLEKTKSSASVASIEGESSLTDDFTIDVVSGGKTEDSFDGGVVEVNADELPVVGKTHVGVLDKHVEVDEDGKSYSTGLIQTDVDDGLLAEASINVLAGGKAKTDSGKHETSAVVDVSVDDDKGVLDDLDVSVLKHDELEMETKAALASVALESPVTDDLKVDVALSDRTTNAFAGGLVEVNGKDMPLLGVTHVGVLDKHVELDEDGNFYSTGLIQTNLDDGLLEDTSVGVLIRTMTVTEDGQWVSDSGASLDLELPGTDAISANVLTRQRFSLVAQTDAPTVGAPPSADEGNSEGNGGSTPVSEVDSDVPAVPESDYATSDGNEEGQETTLPPANEGESGDGFSNEENGTMENDNEANDAVDEPGQESTAGNGFSGDVDADSGYHTGELSGSTDGFALSGTGQSGIMKGFVMNNADPRSSLPKTGGFWDGKRLVLLAVLLIAAGIAMRRLGKSSMSAA